METQARYTLIGAFTVVLVFAGFAFVHWLYNTGGIRNRVVHKVEFESSISGLLVGSAVLFNGIRVGEVARLELNPQKPKQVVATIAVDQEAPIAADTKVELDFQGLTGAPVINLVGGTQLRSGTATQDDTTLVLSAGPAATETMTAAARKALRRFDNFLDDNSEPFQKTVKNFEAFSDALAKNSNRVDGIMTGLEQWTNASTAARNIRTFDLEISTLPSLPSEKPSGLIVVDEPSVLIAFNTDKILLEKRDGQQTTLDDGKWTDNLPNLVQLKIIRSFETAGYEKSISRASGDLTADMHLLLDIRRFHIVEKNLGFNSEIEIFAKVVDDAGHVVGGRLFSAQTPFETLEATVAVKAIETAFGKTTSELIHWVSKTSSDMRRPQPQSQTN